MYRGLSSIVIVSVVAWGGFWAPGAAAAEETAPAVLMQWDFNRPGDLQGWQPNSQIAEPAVADGTLRGRVTGADPSLLGPTFAIPARLGQRVEIRLKSAGSTRAELFWTETLEGRFGGFSQEKTSRFSVIADGQFHVYHIYPFWQSVDKIVRLRFDPPSEGPMEIDWIRIVDAPPSDASSATHWQFASAVQGWHALEELGEPIVRNGALEVTPQGEAPILGSPTLTVPAQSVGLVALRMAVSQGQAGRIYFATAKTPGLASVSFPLLADGQPHTYNVELSELTTRPDPLVFVGVGPSDTAGATARIESITIGNRAAGPAELTMRYFGAEEGGNRVGRRAIVLCTVANEGGELAQGTTATLTVPDGVRLVGQARQQIAPVAYDFPESISWTIESPQVGRVPLSVRLELPGSAPQTATAEMEFTPVPEVAQGSVPEPRPVPSKFDVGAYYFPGWATPDKWRPIQDFPGRKPLLGWYDEANPQVIDWQIKWASEHGIKFFLVDWYWCQGRRSLEHWVQSFEKAQHRKYLQWCVMWANHNPPGTHSREDWRQVTQYWIDHCFNLPEYYRIDGRPAVFMWAPDNVVNDLGGADKAAELYALSQQMAREAGYAGIYFVALGGPTPVVSQCQALQQQGFEGYTSYHTFELAEQRAKTRHFPFSKVVETSPEVWQMADAACGRMQYLPVVETGWSSEPWHANKSLSVYGRTPELVGEICRLARKYAEEHQKKILILGPVNEWGEGSYIEPCTEFGFRSLDQVRAAFCEPGDYPPNVMPTDVGLGPYDLPREQGKTAWQFTEEGNVQGWQANLALRATVRDGALQGQTTGNDPIFFSPALRLPAHTLRHVTIRMKCSANDQGQLFWATRLIPMREANSLRFNVLGDGQFHDYELDLGAHPQWQGTITQLRLDPVGNSNRTIAIESIRLH